MSNDLFSTLKTYINKVSEGERTPQEIAAAVNSWAKESAEALKLKIHEEVEASVEKMGFVKRAEFDRLSAEVSRLKASASSKTSAAKASTVKKPVVRKSAPIKKRAVKKVAQKGAKK